MAIHLYSIQYIAVMLLLHVIVITIFWQMKAGNFEEHHIATILREILKGLEYLHNERKLHRDVKGNDPNNFLLTAIDYFNLKH